MATRKPSLKRIATKLRKCALAYPETREDAPWGHAAFKVREKTFLFMGEEDALTGSVKLPASRYEALELPFTAPTGYGMGKHGWVSFKFVAGDDPPVDILLDWIDESFRAVAPKKLVANLDAERS